MCSPYPYKKKHNCEESCNTQVFRRYHKDYGYRKRANVKKELKRNRWKSAKERLRNTAKMKKANNSKTPVFGKETTPPDNGRR